MTPDCIEGASAWTGEEVGGPDAFAVDLNAVERDAIVDAARRIAGEGKTVADLWGVDVALPELAQTMAAIDAEVAEGCGLVVLRGMPVGELSDDETAVGWHLATAQLGRLRSQSGWGDLMGRVEYVDDGRDWRGYTKSKELNYHTDHADTVALLCVRQSAAGGLSRIVSQAAVHAIIARENPAALTLLQRGFPYAWYDEVPPEATRPASDFDVPVLVEHAGRVQGVYIQSFMLEAAEATGRELTGGEIRAIELVRQVANRPGVALEFAMQPGEALIFDNLSMLHARTAFELPDDPANRRLLYRLWYGSHPPRPRHPGVARYEDALMRAYKDPALAN
ncbi:MAG: TauD/TfdA family dioxygenase [Rhodospirillaceae bacterium]|jgi:hypothetical protein|nr:TauD/TfdA family dioxygenase [Rhodospirillaceae bacterium]MBT6202388.1 TauD/TfdA family dioxygenase [Rhodospirillaceae bacterium]MBT6510691.1 TauD/TfdA family dioxygenase [Rhodospirillaceae bacterium]MBT7612793.1 TauD/TfdA family dioxygenase [Rhodospirillaceae bacterium]MBT7645890.1 TauD/TfdA family dioxygenase [Rhodospirillaceae bacterium]